MAMRLRFGNIIALLVTGAALAGAADDKRVSVWDLKPGTPASALPGPDRLRAFACGSNGGAPRQQIDSFADFRKCRAEPSGLREVYFEYDDELEYIARAHDLTRDITRLAGTAEYGFAVVTSVLIDEAGIMQGLRVVTDARPEYRNDVTEPDRRKREDAYQFGGVMAGRFDLDGEKDCVSLPPSDGETPVGPRFVKRTCNKIDATTGQRVSLAINFFRKPGQSGRNPQNPVQLTQGQFESSARIEIYAKGWSK